MTSVTVVTNGNDAQVGQIVRLMETCFRFEPMYSSRRLVVLSDRMHPDNVSFLRDRHVEVFVYDQEIAAAKETLASDLHAFGKVGKPVLLEAYLRHVPATSEELYLYLDPDVIVQSPLAEFLEGLARDRVHMSVLLYPTHLLRHCRLQMERVTSVMGQPLDPTGTEYCTGVFAGCRGPLLRLLSAWNAFQLEPPFNRLCRSDEGARNAYHDQDFFRCFNRLHPEHQPEIIPYHLVPSLNPPCERLFEIQVAYDALPPRVNCLHPGWDVRPLICHLAGGTCDRVPVLRTYYDFALSPMTANPRPATTFQSLLTSYLVPRREFRFLQVGGFDGVTLDPIRPFIETRKSIGVIIEPNPEPFAKLQQLYARQPDIKCLPIAIAPSRGKQTLYYIPGDDSPMTWQEAIATLDPERGRMHEFNRLAQTCEVECLRLMDVVQQHDIKHLDLLQIDAEGYEFEILRTFDFEKLKPRVVHWEYRHLRGNERRSIVAMLSRFGYRCFEEPHPNDATAFLPEFMPGIPTFPLPEPKV